MWYVTIKVIDQTGKQQHSNRFKEPLVGQHLSDIFNELNCIELIDGDKIEIKLRKKQHEPLDLLSCYNR